MQTIYDMDKRKLLSSVCHASIFFNPLVLTIGIPIAILWTSDDPVVKDNAKEAINFHFNVWILGAILAFVSFFWWTLIALPLIWALGGLFFIVSWIEPIFAIFKCLTNPEQAFRYPFIFRVL